MKKFDSFLAGLIVVAAIVLSVAVVHWISTSDLPFWFKFWLLK